MFWGEDIVLGVEASPPTPPVDRTLYNIIIYNTIINNTMIINNYNECRTLTTKILL